MIPSIPNLSNWAILVIDDDDGNRTLLKDTLMFFQMKVYAAQSGDETLAMLNGIQETLRLVLTDISMPGMNGTTLMNELRKQPKTAQVPIIALTAHAMNGDAERFKGEGFDGYISKPIPEPPTLLRILLTYVKAYATSHKGQVS